MDAAAEIAEAPRVKALVLGVESTNDSSKRKTLMYLEQQESLPEEVKHLTGWGGLGWYGLGSRTKGF